jgi:hypothetical protein
MVEYHSEVMDGKSGERHRKERNATPGHAANDPMDNNFTDTIFVQSMRGLQRSA